MSPSYDAEVRLSESHCAHGETLTTLDLVALAPPRALLDHGTGSGELASRKLVSYLLFIRHTPLALVRSRTPLGSQLSVRSDAK